MADDSAPAPAEVPNMAAAHSAESLPAELAVADVRTADEAPPNKFPRWVRAILATVTIIITAVGVTVSIAAISALQRMPSIVVAQYLRELEQGDATAAMRLGGIKPHTGDILLTDAAYSKITDGIKTFTVAAPVTRRGETTVSATITQGARTYTSSFAVQKDGGIPWLPFWRMSPVEPDTLDFLVGGPAGLTYTVAGLKPRSTSSDTDIRLRALPGSYPVEVVQENKDFDIPTADVQTTPAGQNTSPTVLTAQLTTTGKAAAQKAIDTWLDGCVASRDAKPAGCPFETFPADSGYDISNVDWQLLTRPTATVLSDWDAGGWDVDSTSGTVGATAVQTRRSDGSTGIGITAPFSFSFKGTLTFDSTGAVFTPLITDFSTQPGA